MDDKQPSTPRLWLAGHGLMMAGVAMFALIVVGSFLVINRLGQVYFAPMVNAATRAAYQVIVVFVATTTVGIPTLLTLILTVENDKLRNGAKAIMRIITMVWAILVTILCMFSFAMDFGADILAGFDSVLNIAPAIFAMIGGLNLIAVVSVVLVSFTGSEEHESVSGAVGGIMVWMSEFVLALAGFGFEAYYGMAIGIQALVAALAAMLMSGGFIMSLAKLHDSRRRRDNFDKTVWAFVSMVFVIYIGIVGATAGSHLSGREDLMPKFILAIGERAFFFSQMTLALVLWIAKIWTDRIDWIASDTVKARIHQPVSDRVVSAIAGYRNIRAAIAGMPDSRAMAAPAETPTQRFASEPLRGGELVVPGKGADTAQMQVGDVSAKANAPPK